MNGKETTMPKTDIKVRIIGADGNVYNLLGICRRELGRADYNHALATIADWFIVCSVNEDEDED